MELANPAIGRLKKAVMMGAAISRLRSMMNPPIMQVLMSLMNSPLGFMTDRGPQAYREDMKKPYPEDVVKECAIEALLKGVMWTDNEFNIIASRCYIALNGYWRKVRGITGLTNFRPAPGIPIIHNGQTVVRFGASWKMNGKADQLLDGENKPGRVFAIQVNKGSGPDQIAGKAMRKGLKAVFEQIHGSELGDEPDDATEIATASLPAAASKAAQIAATLGANGGSGKQPMRQAQRHNIDELARVLNMDEATVLDQAGEPVANVADLTSEQAGKIIRRLAELRAEQELPGDAAE